MLGADWVYLVSDLSKLARVGDALLSICWATEAAACRSEIRFLLCGEMPWP